MRIIQKSTEPSSPPLLLPFPLLPSPSITTKEPKKVTVTEFYTHSDGKRKTYTITDCLHHIGEQAIQDPCDVSFMNLFINGVL